MYVKISNDIPTAYLIEQLRRDNPQVSFPNFIPDATLAEYCVHPVLPTERPWFAETSQRLTEGTPTLQNGNWIQVWLITLLSTEEIAQNQAMQDEQVSQQRREAYVAEADPLFFKAQRGEVALSDWLAKVNEIKARFPDAASA